jgi:UDP-N-acetylglucosamine 2-epimerase
MRRAVPVKIVTVVGARPQFVKAAPVSRALRDRHEEVLVHTGQHYDDAMSAALFRDLDLPEPDRNLEVGSGPHGVQTGEILCRLEPLLVAQEPDGVLVYGDTNSTLAGALAASKVTFAGARRPWLAHVEAGLRSFNRAMPEEHNRIVADHLADLLLAPTPTALRHLSREGLGERAELTGDVMVDAFGWARARAGEHLPEVAAANPGYVLLTLHRAENVDDPDRLARLLGAVEVERPVIFPVHPRTATALRSAGLRPPANVHLVDPIGYLAMVALETHAGLVATDSGGVQKEAYLAGVPCVTLRPETEWTETVEAGWNRLAGDDPDTLRQALADPAFMDRSRPRPPLFGDGRATERIVAALERLAAGWAGGSA